MAIRLCPEIQFDAGSHEQVQRRFIDRRRPPALGRRMIMPRRVDMRSVMRAQCQHFAGPPLAIWQLFRGCGMSAEFIRSQLFKPFVSNEEGGFGIGAFEARALAAAMNGRIAVESREDEERESAVWGKGVYGGVELGGGG